MFKTTIKRRPNLDRLIKQVKQLDKPIDPITASNVGVAIVGAMKNMIASGQSPIEGKGRFPAYKAASAVNELKKTGTKSSTRKAVSKAKRGYPYSVKKQYPNKSIRPVNLKLGGFFINDLWFQIIERPEGFGVDVGYFTESEAIKEVGHREGANGQAKRPTIPKGNERIATRIFQAAISVYKKRIRAILNSIS